MTLTTPRGFSAGPMADIDYGVGATGGGWVETAAALAVTQPTPSARTVSIAAGTACAFGIRVTNDAALTQALTAPGSGGAWYLIALRFNWAAKTVTQQALAGPTTGSTSTPSAIPATLPATAQSSPGSQYDLPLAWVFVESADTTATVFDVRMRQIFNQPAASTLNALLVLALQFTPIRGVDIPVIFEGITYRWNNNSWRPWESDWFDFSNYTFSGLATGNAVRWARYGYRAGRAVYEGTLVLQAGNGFNAAAQLQLPLPADNAGAYGQMTGKIVAKNASDTTLSSTGRPYELTWDAQNPGTIEIHTTGATTTSGGTGDPAKNPGIHNQIIGNIPFDEPWAGGDFIGWQLVYDPA